MIQMLLSLPMGGVQNETYQQNYKGVGSVFEELISVHLYADNARSTGVWECIKGGSVKFLTHKITSYINLYRMCIYHLFRPYPTDYHLSIHTLPLIHGHVKVVSQSFYHFSLQSLFLHCTICEIPILSSQFQHSEYAQGVGFTDDFSPSPYHNPVFVWMCTHSSWFDLS